MPIYELDGQAPEFPEAGRYYVADGHNHAVRRVLTDGTVETIAGTGKCGFADGPLATAQFCLPIEVAVAADGALLVSDSLNHRIRKIAGGEVTTLGASDDVVLMFGRETGGLAPAIHERYRDRFVSMPIESPHVRSLNLSTAVGIALYETRRQLTSRTGPR